MSGEYPVKKPDYIPPPEEMDEKEEKPKKKFLDLFKKNKKYFKWNVSTWYEYKSVLFMISNKWIWSLMCYNDSFVVILLGCAVKGIENLLTN